MEIDCFAILEMPRRAWMKPDSVKERFHELSRECHPDQRIPSVTTEATGRIAQQENGEIRDFAELNTAQKTLGEPKERLRHLLELEFPEVASHLSRPTTVAGEIARFVFEWQGVLQTADKFLEKYRSSSSALARALLVDEQYGLNERIESILAQIAKQSAALDQELEEFDHSEWWSCEDKAEVSQKLLDFYHQIGFLTRWRDQFRQRWIELQQ